MKSLHYVILLAFIVLCLPVTVGADSPGWSSGGPYGGQVRALALSPGYDGTGLVLAGTEGYGLFGTTDNGQTWELNTALRGDLSVATIAFSPALADDDVIVLGTPEGIFKSSDGGASWIPTSSGLGDLSVNQVVISPLYDPDQTMLAATSTGLYRSITAGKTWDKVGPDGLAFAVTAVHTGGEGFQALFGASDGLYTSADSGATWQPTALMGVSVISIAYSPDYAQDRDIAVGTLSGAYYSGDGGATWDGPWITGTTVYQASFSGQYAQDGLVALATDDGVHVVDQTGTLVGGQPVGEATFALAGYADTVFAGVRTQGVYRGQLGAPQWEIRNLGITAYPVEAVAASPSYATDLTVYAGGAHGVLVSDDDGQSWQSAGLEGVAVNALVYPVGAAAGDGDPLYVATASGLYRQAADGVTWQSLTGDLPVTSVEDVTMDAEGEIWVATANSGVYQSSGDGHWTARSSGLPALSISAILYLTGGSGNEILLCAVWGEGVFYSADGGRNWQSPDDPPGTPHVRALAAAEGYDERTWSFCGTTAGVYRSGDQGLIWDISGLMGYDIMGLALQPDYVARPHVYAATIDSGVRRSTNGGITWASLNEGLGNLSINALDVTLSSDDQPVLFCATQGGVWRYGDAPAATAYQLMMPLVWRDISGAALARQSESGSVSGDSMMERSERE